MTLLLSREYLGADEGRQSEWQGWLAVVKIRGVSREQGVWELPSSEPPAEGELCQSQISFTGSIKHPQSSKGQTC